MSKLSERIVARLKLCDQKSLSHNKVVFFTLHNEILEAIKCGLLLKVTWQTLYEENKISFKYRAFLQHVYRYADILQEIAISRKYNKNKLSLPKEIATLKFNPIHNLEDF